MLNTSKEELAKLIEMKTEFDASKAQFADIIAKQGKKINEMYAFVHKTYDPLLETK